MSRITLRVLPHNFAAGPPYGVNNDWRPGPVAIYQTVPDGADVVAAPLPAKGGWRVVVYNREDLSVEVTLESKV